MKNTTLIYIEKDDKYLMMYRNSKKNDPNAGKWIGVGGKIEEGETPEECALREVHEETGLTLGSVRFRGIVIFINTKYETEYMFLYTSDDIIREENTAQAEAGSDGRANTGQNESVQGDPKSNGNGFGSGLDIQNGVSINTGMPACDEGELHWIDKDRIEDLPLWEGDRYFLRLLKEDAAPFIMTLKYDGDELTKHSYRMI